MNHRLVQLIAKKEAALNRRLTITEVADQADVSRQTLYTWINQQTVELIKGDTVVKLCAYFQCDVGDLLYLEEVPE